MGIQELLQILRRRWLLIATCVLVALGVAGGLMLQATPQYTSATRLFVSTPQADSTDAYQGGLFSQQRVASYATLITGQAVAQRVVDRLGLDESPTELAEKISATVVPETVILEVKATDPDPERAQQIADAVAKEFTSYVGELEAAGRNGRAPIKATVVDTAALPNSPTSPNIPRTLGLALLLGALVGVGAALLRETLDTSVRTAEDLERETSAPVLGSIPYDPAASKSPLVTQIGLLAPRTEAFRVLRTNLQFVDVDAASKVIVVTSSLPEEGKSTTAANLALTLAIAQHRVALVEGDLRRPRLADYLELQPALGLTSVMIGRSTLSEAIQPTSNKFLDVLTSGPIPPNPAELLQSQAMAEMLQELRASYDVVLVDAPPLLPITDAALLAAQADGAILVVRSRRATRDHVRRSTERLASVGARLLGTVLTMTPARAPQGSGSGFGYKYGYGYGPADPPDELRVRDQAEAVRHKA